MSKSTTPYGDRAPQYLESGWRPIPVVGKGGKDAVPAGATGHKGTVTARKVDGWLKSRQGDNVAIRHDGTIAIDVDAYDDKHGDVELAKLTALLGELPATYTSTARGKSSPSRQYVFRIPEGVMLRGNPAPGIEICQHHHRYSVVWPSVHPDTGKGYRWYRPDGTKADREPHVDEIPDLPTAWLDELIVDRPRAADAPNALGWLELVDTFTEGEPCSHVRAYLDDVEETNEHHVGHDDAIALTYRAFRLGIEGHPGVPTALELTREHFMDYLARARPREAVDELESVTASGGARAQAEPSDEPCTDLPTDATLPLEPAVEPITLEAAYDVFTAWFGLEYDLDALTAVLAAAAIEPLDGDPTWLLVVSGSGNAKTETVQTLAAVGARIVSSISSAGALLSATSKRETTKASTGGLLREVGERGMLVIKDVTTILSQDRTSRAEVLAALREVYDGRWSRTVGTDGGRTLEWTGRLVVIGAVTTAWDKAHEVIASMGDRFVLVRMDSTKGRMAAGRRAISNTGREDTMRTELAAAVAGVLANVDPGEPFEPTDEEADRILSAADIVTRARTAVEVDYRGDVVGAHAPEMPTRFAKQLAQLFRGAVALGMPRKRALRLTIRCARDSMPPLRLEILEDVAAHQYTPTRDVTKRIDKPRATVDRQLQSLHMLELLTVTEEPSISLSGRETVTWRYELANGIDTSCLTLTNRKNKE